ncbi:MAG: methyltransferase [Candidatus Heimdallarchaeota archaeon]|nr:methyltransferase [Candidatus Heimdallarchaeota archaeon]MBY8994522.1 methyltransferase [Candidatus Heimdallarchaeota archaeon]
MDFSNKSSKTLNPYFFHLSGIHPELPVFEVLSVLESEYYSHEILKKSTQCLVLKCSKEGAYLAADRAAYCKRAVRIHYKTEEIEDTVLKLAKKITQEIDFEDIMNNHKSFLVRVYRVGKAYSEYDSMDLEVAIGKKIWDKMNGACEVDTKNPDITFVLLFTQDELLFGEEVYARKKGSFESRRADRRPYFKPGTLEPRFARMMVNLSKASTQSFLLDPFCGPGGIILEGVLMNCSVVGLDIDKRMVKGSIRNLAHYKPNSQYHVFVSDARKLPFHNNVKSIATDPPYGRATSTYGKEVEDLLDQFFSEASNALVKGGTLAIGMLDEIPLEEIAKDYDFHLSIFEKIYIHKSLTRRVGVFVKK